MSASTGNPLQGWGGVQQCTSLTSAPDAIDADSPGATVEMHGSKNQVENSLLETNDVLPTAGPRV